MLFQMFFHAWGSGVLTHVTAEGGHGCQGCKDRTSEVEAGSGLPLSLEPALGTPVSLPSAPGHVPGNLRPRAIFLRAWEGFGEYESHRDLEDVVEKETIF